MNITALVLTFNEEANIERTLARLAWVDAIVVIDSHSSDATRAIAGRHPKVRVLERTFTTHAEQWNFGLEQAGITTEWVLALDADFVLTDPIIREIAALQPEAGTHGYRASFTYCVGGRPLRGAAYPPLTVLFRRHGARYEQDGHTQRVKVGGRVVPLAAKILHDDRKPLGHWLAAQIRYMRLEAEKLGEAGPRSLGPADRIRKMVVVAPLAMFLYCYLLRAGVLDGRAGLYYALQRATSELLLSLMLVERKLRRRDSC